MGTSSEVAIEKFLEDTAQLDLYGVELYHVLDSHRNRKVIGVGPECVQIFNSHMDPLKRSVLIKQTSLSVSIALSLSSCLEA